MIIVIDAKTTDCTIYGPMKLLFATNFDQTDFSSFIECHWNKWKILPFILLRRKYRMGAETVNNESQSINFVITCALFPLSLSYHTESHTEFSCKQSASDVNVDRRTPFMGHPSRGSSILKSEKVRYKS